MRENKTVSLVNLVRSFDRQANSDKRGETRPRLEFVRYPGAEVVQKFGRIVGHKVVVLPDRSVEAPAHFKFNHKSGFHGISFPYGGERFIFNTDPEDGSGRESDTEYNEYGMWFYLHSRLDHWQELSSRLEPLAHAAWVGFGISAPTIDEHPNIVALHYSVYEGQVAPVDHHSARTGRNLLVFNSSVLSGYFKVKRSACLFGNIQAGVKGYASHSDSGDEYSITVDQDKFRGSATLRMPLSSKKWFPGLPERNIANAQDGMYLLFDIWDCITKTERERYFAKLKQEEPK